MPHALSRSFSSRWLTALLLLGLSALPALASPSFLVDADWLAGHLDDENLIVLEVRYHPHRYFTVGHIPGAVQVQRFKDLGDNQASPIMRFPSRSAFQETLRGWGVNDDSLLVLYDDSSTALTSRLYYLLELYGFDMQKVKILNGGTLEWTGFNELTKEPTPARPRGSVTLKDANPDLFVEWTQVYDDVVSRRDPKVILIDARPHDMYTGEVIRHAIQGGHIPGAVNRVSLDGVDGQTGKWRDEATLATLYASIPKDKRLYVYCHDGFRMSLAYLQLKSLGYRDVRLYNGGWSHWGNELTLPVVEGPEPLGGDFAL
ncbi:rhodanese-like domain-containing protein [uncultured Thiocystis sp.]|jgi:thiosulfate/3-mercaptopyruvate sulfurtransferase|uniref:sulfurtransferase n=1 Tax=uncultured Thiocystis sp. TaxID=1202134 RepID=UPI0025F2B653|nr:rhodanese-like domain-containing protein [uncultured Thiocystis sp.]